MLARGRDGTVIGVGLKVLGKVTANGLVKVYGQIDGDVQCATLVLSRRAQINGAIKATTVIVDGRIEGPIEASEVILKRRAHVLGDIDHQSLVIMKGARFEGRSLQPKGSIDPKTDRVGKKQRRQLAINGRETTL